MTQRGMTEAAVSAIPGEPLPGRSRTRMQALPVLAEMSAVARYFRDKGASRWGKAFLLGSVAYIIWPADLIPDVAPVIGWLDDLGVAAFAMAYLVQVVRKYRAE